MIRRIDQAIEQHQVEEPEPEREPGSGSGPPSVTSAEALTREEETREKGADGEETRQGESGRSATPERVPPPPESSTGDGSATAEDDGNALQSPSRAEAQKPIPLAVSKEERRKMLAAETVSLGTCGRVRSCA